MTAPAATAAKVLALCADDYGASDGVCEGILELIGLGRLSATSVLSGGPAWPARAAELAALSAVRDGQVQVGLHFNLTEGRPLSQELAALHPHGFGLGELIVKAHARLLPVQALTAEWRHQWQAFVQAFGRAPDYVDGHQHVHHLPQVREVVLSAHPPAVRATGHVCGPGHAFKRWVIEATGGAALQRQLQTLGLRHNTTLWGAYDFVEPDYRGLMRQWLRELPAQGALLFCHPGHTATESLGSDSDPIAPAREREWRYLRSDEFTDDLLQMGVRLGQAW
jgi:predicted glycoside hydrolase/deacetylase ChbG (UPF0249 family)